MDNNFTAIVNACDKIDFIILDAMCGDEWKQVRPNIESLIKDAFHAGMKKGNEMIEDEDIETKFNSWYKDFIKKGYIK